MKSRFWRALTVALSLLALTCQSELDAGAKSAVLDEPFFRCRVHPVLIKTCAQLACHGNGTRYFRLFGRNRMRLGGTEAQRNSLILPAERCHNFEAASAFVDASEPDDSLLLRKPLEQSAGGYYHGGASQFGAGDVFSARTDPDFKVLAEWVAGQTDDPSCPEPGANE